MRDFEGLAASMVPTEVEQLPNYLPVLRRDVDHLDWYLSDLSKGMGRIQKGEVPDGSGTPIADAKLSDLYWVLLGRSANQVGYGGTGAGGTATIGSTRHATKGFVYLGGSSGVAFDETNTLLGVNEPAPAARLHLSHTTGGGTQINRTNTASPAEAGSWGLVGASKTVALNTDDSDTSYVQSATGSNIDMYVKMEVLASTPATCTIKIKARRTNLGLTNNKGIDVWFGPGIPPFGGSTWPGGLIATNLVPTTVGLSYTEYSYTLSSTEISDIAASGLGWADIYVGFRTGLGNQDVYNVTVVTYETPGSLNVTPLQKWEDLTSSNTLNFASDGGSATDLELTGTPPLMVTAGDDTSGLRLLTGSSVGRIEVGTSAQGAMNLTLCGNRNSTGTLLTSKFSSTSLTGTITIAGGTPAAGKVLTSQDANGLGAWQTVSSLLDDDLDAIAALTGTGLLARTATDTWALRTLGATSDRIAISNGDGVAGNPTVDASMSSANWDFTRGVTILSGTDEIELDIRPAAGQTAAAFRVYQQADSIRMFQVDASGTVTCGDTTHTDSVVRFQARAPSTQAANIAQVVRAYAGGNFTAWSVGSAGENVFGDVTANGAGVVRCQINQGSGQTVDLFRARNTAGSVDFVKIDKDGVFSLSAPLAIGSGGTGQSTATAAFNALDPLTTKGDLITHDGTNSVRQGIGTDGFVLTADSAQTNGLKWAASAGGSHVLLDGSVHSDTVAQAVSRGSLVYGNATPKWDELVIGTTGKILTTDGTDVLWSSFQFTGLANPSASVGLAAVNGTATTAMRSDGAPALSQAIAPSWTGTHTWGSATGLIRVPQVDSAYNPILLTGRATPANDGFTGSGADDLLRATDNTGASSKLVRIDSRANFYCSQGTRGSPGYIAFGFETGQFMFEVDAVGAGSIQWSVVGVGLRGALKLGPNVSALRTWELPNCTGTLLAWGSAGTNSDMPAAGSLLYGAGVAATLSELAIGSSGTILTSSGSAPQWSTNAAVVDLTRTWATVQNFPDDKFRVIGSATASKVLALEVDGISAATTRTWTAQDQSLTVAGIDVAQTWTGAQTVTYDGGGSLTFSSDIVGLATGLSFLDNGATSGTNFRLSIEVNGAIPADAVFTLPGTGGAAVTTTATQTLTNKTISVLKTATTVSGIPVIAGTVTNDATANLMAKATYTAQSAAISVVDLTDTTPAGMYLVSYYLECTAADAIEVDTVNFQINYTDTVGATTQTSANLGVAATTTGTTAVKGTMQVKLASGKITYQTNISGSLGATAKYALQVRVQFLG